MSIATWAKCAVWLGLAASALQGGTVTIDFDATADGTAAASTYASQGVTFSSGVILVSGAFGGGLNELDFPPASGQTVFVNEADTTTLSFTVPILSFSGAFTYGGPLTLNFYNSASAIIATLTSAYSANVATGGDPGSASNEIISSAVLADAVRVDILAPSADFALDDLTFSTSDATSSDAPEPSADLLVMGAVFCVLGSRRARRAIL